MKIKVCPECNTEDFLMWNFSGDGTTDCGSCACNWEEHELKEKEKDDEFDFNQDNSIELGDEYRSPGWDRLKKRLIKWKK